jgi:hypothetical protein
MTLAECVPDPQLTSSLRTVCAVLVATRNLPTWLAAYARRGFALVFWERTKNPAYWKAPHDTGCPA